MTSENLWKNTYIVIAMQKRSNAKNTMEKVAMQKVLCTNTMQKIPMQKIQTQK